MEKREFIKHFPHKSLVCVDLVNVILHRHSTLGEAVVYKSAPMSGWFSRMAFMSFRKLAYKASNAGSLGECRRRRKALLISMSCVGCCVLGPGLMISSLLCSVMVCGVWMKSSVLETALYYEN